MLELIFMYLPLSLFIALFYFVFKHTFARSEKKNERLLQEAIQAGHVVNARLIKAKTEWWLDQATRMEDDTKMVRVGTYEYEYNGKTHRVKLCSERYDMPKERELYFIKNPKKVATGKNIACSEISFWKYLRLVPLPQLF